MKTARDTAVEIAGPDLVKDLEQAGLRVSWAEKGQEATVPAKGYLTASDVAAICEVDLKTVHNWCDKGHLTFFRTPGRHLRFNRLDVVAFLKSYHYPVPEGLSP